MSIKSDIQDTDCRDQGKKKSWQDSRINRIGQNGNDGEHYSEIPEGMILIPLNLARRFEKDEADASDRKMLSGFILDS